MVFAEVAVFDVLGVFEIPGILVFFWCFSVPQAGLVSFIRFGVFGGAQNVAVLRWCVGLGFHIWVD